jgi:hypothetical protein
MLPADEGGEDEGGQWCEVCFEKGDAGQPARNGNSPFLRCVKCKVQVHKRCYGAQKVPDDGSHFTCDSCASHNSTLKVCILLTASRASSADMSRAV